MQDAGLPIKWKHHGRCENLSISYGVTGLRLHGLSGGTQGLSGDTWIGTNENERSEGGKKQTNKQKINFFCFLNQIPILLALKVQVNHYIQAKKCHMYFQVFTP
jgi:hypothetical protein